MATIATLDTVLRASTSSFDRNIKKSQGLLRSFASAAANISVAGGLVGLIGRNFAKMGDEIGKMSKRTGVAVEELQGLTFAAEQSGASAESVEKAIRGMNRSILDGQDGMSTAVRNFEALGLSLLDFEGLSVEQRFKLVADALNQIEDESTRSALAMKIFGRSGSDLLPMLGSVEGLTKHFKELGLALSSDEIAKAEELNDNLNIMRHQWMKLSAALGTTVLPVLNKVLDLLTQINNLLGSKTMATLIGAGVGARLGAIAGPKGALIGAGVGGAVGLASAFMTASEPQTKQLADVNKKLDIAEKQNEEIISAQEKTVDASKNLSRAVAQLPPVLQKGSAETLSFINKLNREDQQKQIVSELKKQNDIGEDIIEILKNPPRKNLQTAFVLRPV